MKIRCIDGKGSKLIEGQIYDAIYILGSRELSPNAYGWQRVELYNGDRYNNIYKFETLEGKPLNTIFIDERPDPEEQRKLDVIPKNISNEDLLRTCIKYTGGNSSKYFVNGNIYKVADINKSYRWELLPFRVKIEGFEHFWTTTKSFRLLDKEELRHLKIDIIDGVEVVTNNYTRKFDAISTEERLKVLINSLIRARREFAKNDFQGITMEEFIVSSDNKYGITLEDVEEFKSLKIPELFK